MENIDGEEEDNVFEDTGKEEDGDEEEDEEDLSDMQVHLHCLYFCLFNENIKTVHIDADVYYLQVESDASPEYDALSSGTCRWKTIFKMLNFCLKFKLPSDDLIIWMRMLKDFGLVFQRETAHPTLW